MYIAKNLFLNNNNQLIPVDWNHCFLPSKSESVVQIAADLKRQTDIPLAKVVKKIQKMHALIDFNIKQASQSRTYSHDSILTVAKQIKKYLKDILTELGCGTRHKKRKKIRQMPDAYVA